MHIHAHPCLQMVMPMQVTMHNEAVTHVMHTTLLTFLKNSASLGLFTALNDCLKAIRACSSLR
eukprot:323188-Chlamydomonas_euryale.AAC.1